MTLWRVEKKFVLPWLIAHGVAWPLGLVSAFWSGWSWLSWLTSHIPGEPRLGFGWYPNHEYIVLFLWSAFLLGGAIVGLWVGIAQWLVLRLWYKIATSWVIVNVLAWSFSGILLRLIILILGPTSRFSVVPILVPLLLGTLISGFWLEPIISRPLHEHLPMSSCRTSNPINGRFVIYPIIFVGIGVGLLTLLIIVVIVSGF